VREISLTPKALEEYNYWKKVSPQIAQRIKRLLEAISQQPFEGIGKPEKLRFELSGLWSRRIDSEHRLVYIVTDTEIQVISCRYHYQK
jgi:toxin YoeB